MKHKKLLSLSLSALLCLNPLTAYADSENVDESMELINSIEADIEIAENNDAEVSVNDFVDSVVEDVAIIEPIEKVAEIAENIEIDKEVDIVEITEESDELEKLNDSDNFNDIDSIESLNDAMVLNDIVDDTNLNIIMRVHFENDNNANGFDDAIVYEDYYHDGEYGIIQYDWKVTIPSDWCNVETLSSTVHIGFSFCGDNVSGWYPTIIVSDDLGNELTYNDMQYPLITTRDMSRIIGSKRDSCTVSFNTNANNNYVIGVYQGWNRIYIKPHEHNFEVISEKPTCDKNGSYESIYCDECGKMIVGDNLIPAIGHNYNQYIDNDDETHTIVCEHDNSHTIEESHKYSSWKIIKNATLSENGEKERVCELCNHRQTEVINAMGYTVRYLTRDNVVIETKFKIFDISEENLNLLAPIAPTYDGYKFIGWEYGKPNGTGLLQAIATYKEITLYTISWYDEDLNLLETNMFDTDEEEPTYSQELPTKESDSKYDYIFKEWVKQDIPLNDDDISYVASYNKIPKKYNYTIRHEYYTDGIFDGFVSNSENYAEIDDIISELDIEINNLYDGNVYKYISITPSTLQIQPMPATNEFVLRYDRYSYRVIHKYLNEDGDLDGEAEEVFYGLEDDEIDASIKQQPLYNEELYSYKEDSGNLIISTNKNSNVITITYQKEKQLPKETSYLVKWMDTDENELKSEVRDGFIDEVKIPLEDDYKLDGYTFVETQDNILSISLKEDESENVLKLYFEKDKPIVSEEPTVSESPSPSPSNRPVESEEPSESPKPSDSPKPSESPVVSEEPSPSPSIKPSETPSVSPSVKPSDSPKPSDKPIVSENPSPSPSSKPSDSPKPTESTKPSETPIVSESPKSSSTPTVSEKPSVSSTPTVSNTPNSSKPNVESTPTPSVVPPTVEIPSTEAPKTSVPKKETETTTIADPDMPLSATPTKTADELDFWIVLSISTFGLLLFLYNRKK